MATRIILATHKQPCIPPGPENFAAYQTTDDHLNKQQWLVYHEHGDQDQVYSSDQYLPTSGLQPIDQVNASYISIMVKKQFAGMISQQPSSTTFPKVQQSDCTTPLTKSYLRRHCNLLYVIQYYTTQDALTQFAFQHGMSAKVWCHGIHAFLELLRHWLPDFTEHVLGFIYLVYSMMALLGESIPRSMETWIECLGNLACYWMTMADFHARGTWSNFADVWYNQATIAPPIFAGIQHHLAVVARLKIAGQLLYYTKALFRVVRTFDAQESIMLLFVRFSIRNSEGKVPSPVNALSSTMFADRIVRTIRYFIRTRVVGTSRHQPTSRTTLLGLLLLNLPMTLALPLQSEPRARDYNVQELILTIIAWMMFLVLSISIPVLRSRVHRNNQVTTAVYPAYAASIAIMCAGDTGIAGLVKGLIQGCWLGFTTWYYLAVTPPDDRNWIHVPLHLVLFVVIYQVLSTSQMGDAAMNPDLSTCIPYLSICLTVTIFAALSEYSGRTVRLAERLRAAYAHENLPE